MVTKQAQRNQNLENYQYHVSLTRISFLIKPTSQLTSIQIHQHHIRGRKMGYEQ